MNYNRYLLPARTHTTSKLPRFTNHFQALIEKVDAFNLMWKRTVGHAGLVLVGHKTFLLFQLLTDSASTARLTRSLALKSLSYCSILCMRDYIQIGCSQRFRLSLFFSSSYALMWLYFSVFLHLSLSAIEVSPLCIIYYLNSLVVL
ncbi:unnamed protein product [Peronospora belbahrii]|uniref:Transmembrane protein n=1 Tax=Peronospora belbahrii TaxID=622444 RepID=A0ABN8D2I2_9STRA|nr:unnamed protein product [Peronospora belbahrii]